MIAVVDAGAGNLRSVARALEAVGATGVVVTGDPEVLRRADRVVFPGQGAFGDCATALAGNDAALGDVLRERIAAGTPYLGICLGLQVLFADSEEAPRSAGLGVFAGSVRRLTAPRPDVKIPHVGWNRVEPAGRASRVLGDGGWFYFVHSYAVVPEQTAVVTAWTEHGAPFVSAIERDNVLAVQFHPEKSQRGGLALLRRWLAS